MLRFTNRVTAILAYTNNFRLDKRKNWPCALKLSRVPVPAGPGFDALLVPVLEVLLNASWAQVGTAKGTSNEHTHDSGLVSRLGHLILSCHLRMHCLVERILAFETFFDSWFIALKSNQKPECEQLTLYSSATFSRTRAKITNIDESRFSLQSTSRDAWTSNSRLCCDQSSDAHVGKCEVAITRLNQSAYPISDKPFSKELNRKCPTFSKPPRQHLPFCWKERITW